VISSKRIAVIGSGIAGNGVAWALANGSDHRVTVFEASARPGGHSATVDIDYDGRRIAVDTGFIVYNEPNYPNLTRLFAHLGIETHQSDMSFSVSEWGGSLEWTSRPADFFGGLLPIKAGVPSPVHLRVLRDIMRFNRIGVVDLHAGRLKGLSLGAYLARGRFSKRFRDDYLIAMGSAIWSMPPGSILDFPAEAFLSFFENHRLLRLSRPVWRSVVGGSRSYVDAIYAGSRLDLRLGSPVVAVSRSSDGVAVTTNAGETEIFDDVVLACHSDQALRIVSDASEAERALLAGVRYRGNEVFLHRDAGLMPRRESAWASWNVIKTGTERVSVSYWMNLLQGIDRECPLFVSLNPVQPPRPELTFARFHYDHPQFDQRAIEAQGELPLIQGRNRLWFCGAWTKFGFHEDGLHSGLTVAEALGATIPWTVTPRQILEAAE
jgi:predicted NAD/FAD-binding protein